MAQKQENGEKQVDRTGMKKVYHKEYTYTNKAGKSITVKAHDEWIKDIPKKEKTAKASKPAKAEKKANGDVASKIKSATEL